MGRQSGYKSLVPIQLPSGMVRKSGLNGVYFLFTSGFIFLRRMQIHLEPDSGIVDIKYIST
jgi:hypothetical protein